MLAYVKGVQREEIRIGLDCVKHQDMVSASSIWESFIQPHLILIPFIFSESNIIFMTLVERSLGENSPFTVFTNLFIQAGTYIGDDHKEYFSGDAALKAGGKENTMNQFETKVRKQEEARCWEGSLYL